MNLNVVPIRGSTTSTCFGYKRIDSACRVVCTNCYGISSGGDIADGIPSSGKSVALPSATSAIYYGFTL